MRVKNNGSTELTEDCIVGSLRKFSLLLFYIIGNTAKVTRDVSFPERNDLSTKLLSAELPLIYLPSFAVLP